MLATAIAAPTPQDRQSPRTFRAEAYVIANFLVMLDGNGKPMVGLTVADFALLVEKKIPAAFSVSEPVFEKPK